MESFGGPNSDGFMPDDAIDGSGEFRAHYRKKGGDWTRSSATDVGEEVKNEIRFIKLVGRVAAGKGGGGGSRNVDCIWWRFDKEVGRCVYDERPAVDGMMWARRGGVGVSTQSIFG